MLFNYGSTKLLCDCLKVNKFNSFQSQRHTRYYGNFFDMQLNSNLTGANLDSFDAEILHFESKYCSYIFLPCQNMNLTAILDFCLVVTSISHEIFPFVNKYLFVCSFRNRLIVIFF